MLFFLVLNIYLLTSPGVTYYDYFTRLSKSLINGKLYVIENPSWLNELIPVGDKYYVALPPMPAIVMMPFVYIFGPNFSETYFSIVLGSINVVLVYLLLKRLNFYDASSVFVAIFFAFGTNHWFAASVGSSWYLAHIVAVFLTLLALIESAGKKRLWLIGLLIGAGFWARTSVLFTVLFFYIYLWKDLWIFKKNPVLFLKEFKLTNLFEFNLKNLTNFIIFNSTIFLFILFDSLYNYARFGDFSPFSPYRLIQNVDTNTVVNGVYMSIMYIPRHIDALIFRLPKFSETFPYMTPSLYATAIWFTSPVLIYIFIVKRSLLKWACWLAILPTFFIVIQWAGVGFSQFGYRFALDFMPFLLILLALGLGQKPSKFAYFLLTLSILVNAWGTIILNKYGIYIM